MFLTLADAIGLAEAIISDGSFVTADHHELDTIEKNENIKFTWIRFAKKITDHNLDAFMAISDSFENIIHRNFRFYSFYVFQW
jgi:hypothetical protein